MQEYQQRIVVEAHKLREKLTKLASFISRGEIFTTLDGEDQSLLRQQRDAMSEYLDVLDKRIARFAL